MFVSVSLVRMPPVHWGGDTDFFYRSTYGPALKNADGLRRALYGPVARLTEQRPRFSHTIVLFWDSQEAWEAARKRIGGMPPLPRGSQGLETYAGELAEIAPEGQPGEVGMLGVWLFNLAPSTQTPASQVRALPGLRQLHTGAPAVVEVTESAARGQVALLEFDNRDAAEAAARQQTASPPIQQWATDIETVYFDVLELARQ